MKFQPLEIPPGTPSFFQDAANRTWVPLYSHACSFGPDIFTDKMMNLVRNPNLNSSWLFRADILYDEAKVTGSSSSSSSATSAGDTTTTTPSSSITTDEAGPDNTTSHPDAIAHADTNASSSRTDSEVRPVAVEIRGMTLERTLVRRLIPRNERRDKPLDQTCLFYTSTTTTPLDSVPGSPAAGSRPGHQDAVSGSPSPSPASLSTLVIYMPHSPSADALPFYHPKVQGIAHLHQWDPSGKGVISVHFLPYPEHPVMTDAKIQRTAYHLLEIIDKHGHGAAEGYVKRVNHDVVIRQDRFQNRYALLKSKYARRLVDSWAEKTDPTKHVFEDLGIAAFLIELWSDMYPEGTATTFPGFVDIGCGNGLLVYLLTQEGYAGWGFDARERKSWAQYRTGGQPSPSGSSLEERLLLPAMVSRGRGGQGQAKAKAKTKADANLVVDDADILERPAGSDPSDDSSHGVVHDGAFAPGTFIVSNHADELTPWTPILAALSRCPFIMIPCCSHSLAGDKFRAPPPRDKTKARSTYASLVDWVSCIAEDCGWKVETEMLRIPSTRNTCLLGRTRTKEVREADVEALVAEYGGTGGYYENVAKLIKSGPRGH
ncbi:uracil-O(2)--methyltransferase [Trichoderma gracile]